MKRKNAILRPSQILVFCGGLAILPAAGAPPIPGPVPVTVLSVTDGDTYRVRMPDGTTARVRVLRLDTPEIGAHARCPAEAAAGEDARAAAAAALARAPDQITLTELRWGVDRYGRLLAHVWVGPLRLSDILIASGAGHRSKGRRSPYCAVP